jgi:hypothetical protein
MVGELADWLCHERVTSLEWSSVASHNSIKDETWPVEEPDSNMKIVPDDIRCDHCNAPATTQLRNKLTNHLHSYCSQHQPDLGPPGYQHPQFVMERYRRPPDSPSSRMLAADPASQEHQALALDMLGGGNPKFPPLLGGYGACLYLLSRLTGRDQFAEWNDQFVENVREYVVKATGGAARVFEFTFSSVDYMVALLKRDFYRAQNDGYVESKPDRAVILLLEHPDWTDNQIAEAVPTTVKQLRRNLDYTCLRARHMLRPH